MTDSPTRSDESSPLDAGHFDFGRNWSRFLSMLDDQRIAAAGQSLRELLHVTDLQGRRFLDAGSGSGLFSLAAWRLGADVVSVDLDPQSVACSSELRRRYADGKPRWDVQAGSLLDRTFVESLGTFDVVYSWGVLHHTGDQWTAIDLLIDRVNPGGLYTLAIYNDEQFVSRIWRGIKRLYQRLPAVVRPLYVLTIGGGLFARRAAFTLMAAIVRLCALRNPLTPFANWLHESQGRGMHGWYDLVDWVGGWPFEVARPEEVFRHLRDRGFTLVELTTSGGHGCNEFVFQRIADSTA